MVIRKKRALSTCGLSLSLEKVTEIYAKLLNVPFYVQEMEEGGIYPIDIAFITDCYSYEGYIIPNYDLSTFSHQQTHLNPTTIN